MALMTTNGMSVDGLDAAPNGPGLAQQLGNQVDEFYGKSVANAAALPASGKYPGQRVWLVDVKGWGVWNGSAWVTDTAWAPLTLNNSWVAFDATGATQAVPSYQRRAGMVYLRGVMKSGTTATTMFTLPVGCRPSKPRTTIHAAGPGVCAIDLTATGVASLSSYAASGNNGFVSLETSFVAEG